MSVEEDYYAPGREEKVLGIIENSDPEYTGEIFIKPEGWLTAVPKSVLDQKPFIHSDTMSEILKEEEEKEVPGDRKAKLQAALAKATAAVNAKAKIDAATKNGNKTENRIVWTDEMDHRLVEAVVTYGTQNWNHIASRICDGCTSRQARLRWTDVLDPANLNLKSGEYTAAEEQALIEYVRSHLNSKNSSGVSWDNTVSLLGRNSKSCSKKYSDMVKSGKAPNISDLINGVSSSYVRDAAAAASFPTGGGGSAGTTIPFPPLTMADTYDDIYSPYIIQQQNFYMNMSAMSMVGMPPPLQFPGNYFLGTGEGAGGLMMAPGLAPHIVVHPPPIAPTSAALGPAVLGSSATSTVSVYAPLQTLSPDREEVGEEKRSSLPRSSSTIPSQVLPFSTEFSKATSSASASAAVSSSFVSPPNMAPTARPPFHSMEPAASAFTSSAPPGAYTWGFTTHEASSSSSSSAAAVAVAAVTTTTSGTINAFAASKNKKRRMADDDDLTTGNHSTKAPLSSKSSSSSSGSVAAVTAAAAADEAVVGESIAEKRERLGIPPFVDQVVEITYSLTSNLKLYLKFLASQNTLYDVVENYFKFYMTKILSGLEIYSQLWTFTAQTKYEQKKFIFPCESFRLSDFLELNLKDTFDLEFETKYGPRVVKLAISDIYPATEEDYHRTYPYEVMKGRVGRKQAKPLHDPQDFDIFFLSEEEKTLSLQARAKLEKPSSVDWSNLEIRALTFLIYSEIPFNKAWKNYLQYSVLNRPKKVVQEKMHLQKRVVAAADDHKGTARSLYDGYQCLIHECLPEALRTLQTIRLDHLDAYRGMGFDVYA